MIKPKASSLSLFFSFSVVQPTEIFLAFSKEKSNQVVKPFFTFKLNSFNLKNEHGNNLGKNKNKNRDSFTVYHRTGVSMVDPFFPRCLNFTTTSTNFSAILIWVHVFLFPGSKAIMLGYQASSCETSCDLLFFFQLFFSTYLPRQARIRR